MNLITEEAILFKTSLTAGKENFCAYVNYLQILRKLVKKWELQDFKRPCGICDF